MERISSILSRSFTSKVDSVLEELAHPGKQTENHKSCSPLLKMAEKHEGIPKELKTAKLRQLW